MSSQGVQLRVRGGISSLPAKFGPVDRIRDQVASCDVQGRCPGCGMATLPYPCSLLRFVDTAMVPLDCRHR